MESNNKAKQNMESNKDCIQSFTLTLILTWIQFVINWWIRYQRNMLKPIC